MSFWPTTRDDTRRIAELFKIISGYVVEHLWSTMPRSARSRGRAVE